MSVRNMIKRTAATTDVGANYMTHAGQLVAAECKNPCSLTCIACVLSQVLVDLIAMLSSPYGSRAALHSAANTASDSMCGSKL